MLFFELFRLFKLPLQFLVGLIFDAYHSMLSDDSLLWVHSCKQTIFTLLSAELVEHFE